jgi:hypothetical protein
LWTAIPFLKERTKEKWENRGSIGKRKAGKFQRVPITRKNDIYSNVNGIDVGNDVIFTATLLNIAEEGT